MVRAINASRLSYVFEMFEMIIFLDPVLRRIHCRISPQTSLCRERATNRRRTVQFAGQDGPRGDLDQ